MSKDTSEPAFPFTCQGPTTGPEFYYGLSMRDYFAAQALQGMLAHSTRYRSRYVHLHWHDAISQEAYELADSMLQERTK